VSQCSGRALSAPDILVTSAASVTAAVSSVTVGVTDPGTVIASALRRIRPACSQAFSRRLVRVLFQPHWRPSLAALTATRPSGWEQPSQRLQVIEGHSLQNRPAVRLFMQYLAQRAPDCAPMCGRCRSNGHQHSRDVLRDRFLAPVVGAMRRIVAHVAPAPGRRHDPTISPYASCCLPARPFPSG
jgi:hypothetical protein